LKGVLAATAGLLALDAHASNWCPTSTDYQITCSNCSRELTCDTYGISIEILGNNVTLEGQGYSIYNAPYNGITVSPSSGAADATIKHLNIYDAGGTGIVFSGGVSSNWAYVEKVFVSGSAGDGIQNGSWSPLEIDSSWTYDNAYGVSGSYASSTAYTDFLHSSSQGNSFGGYYSGSSAGSWIRNSYFWNNGSIGLDISYAQNLWVDNNGFSSSTGTGLSVTYGDGTSITNNSGNGNSNYDCIVTNSSGTSASGNSWNSYSGSGCVY